MFLPAAKPSGLRKVGVVVADGVGGGLVCSSPASFSPPSCSPTLNFLRGGILLD